MDIVITDTLIDPVDNISKVRISWSEPIANGEFITKYQIMILKYGGVINLEDLIYCDGSQQQIILNMYCDIPMTTLRVEPYNLVKGTVIQARVRAYNLFEWG